MSVCGPRSGGSRHRMNGGRAGGGGSSALIPTHSASLRRGKLTGRGQIRAVTRAVTRALTRAALKEVLTAAASNFGEAGPGRPRFAADRCIPAPPPPPPGCAAQPGRAGDRIRRPGPETRGRKPRRASRHVRGGGHCHYGSDPGRAAGSQRGRDCLDPAAKAGPAMGGWAPSESRHTRGGGNPRVGPAGFSAGARRSGSKARRGRPAAQEAAREEWRPPPHLDGSADP